MPATSEGRYGVLVRDDRPKKGEGWMGRLPPTPRRKVRFRYFPVDDPGWRGRGRCTAQGRGWAQTTTPMSRRVTDLLEVLTLHIKTILGVEGHKNYIYHMCLTALKFIYP